MSESKRIKTALVSVYHKEGLDEIITKLHEEGVEFLSTGGTRQFIESLGYPCKAFEGFPIALITAGLIALAFMGFSGLQVWPM